MKALRRDKQVMVFVHSRKDTVKTARTLQQLATNKNAIALLDNKDHKQYQLAFNEIQKSKNRDIVELFNIGIINFNLI